MIDKAKENSTGIFFSKSGGDYVVLWRGQEVVRYDSIEAFVDAHQAGLVALDDTQAELLEKYYQSIGISGGRSPDVNGAPET